MLSKSEQLQKARLPSEPAAATAQFIQWTSISLFLISQDAVTKLQHSLESLIKLVKTASGLDSKSVIGTIPKSLTLATSAFLRDPNERPDPGEGVQQNKLLEDFLCSFTFFS